MVHVSFYFFSSDFLSEQIPLATIGFMLWFIIPAAFVELPTSNVNGLSQWKQLKIYCAGVKKFNVAIDKHIIHISFPYLNHAVASIGLAQYNFSSIGFHFLDVITNYSGAFIPNWSWCLCCEFERGFFL